MDCRYRISPLSSARNSCELKLFQPSSSYIFLVEWSYFYNAESYLSIYHCWLAPGYHNRDILLIRIKLNLCQFSMKRKCRVVCCWLELEIRHRWVQIKCVFILFTHWIMNSTHWNGVNQILFQIIKNTDFPITHFCCNSYCSIQNWIYWRAVNGEN